MMTAANSYRLRIAYVPEEITKNRIHNKLEEMNVLGRYLDNIDEGGLQNDKHFSYMCFGDYEEATEPGGWHTALNDITELSKSFPEQIFIWESYVQNDKFKGWAGMFFKNGERECHAGYEPDVFKIAEDKIHKEDRYEDEEWWAYIFDPEDSDK